MLTTDVGLAYSPEMQVVEPVVWPPAGFPTSVFHVVARLRIMRHLQEPHPVIQQLPAVVLAPLLGYHALVCQAEQDGLF